MDSPSDYRNAPARGQQPVKVGKHRTTRAQKIPQKPQLFEDTSMQSHNMDYQGAYLPAGMPPGPPQFPGKQLLDDPMVANMAMQYGQNLADQGKDYLNKNLEQYVSTSKLKYYFAVDTSYVVKKLGLLAFPYTHTDWSVKYNQDEPVAPRYDVNAPDLYIPVMAFVTYILVAGLTLGTQNKFSPEHLGMQASSALVWLIIEILAILLSLYIINASSQIKYLDLVAYCGYKYVGMIWCLLSSLILHSSGYYFVLLWTSLTTAFFLVRSLKVQVVSSDQYTANPGQKRLYILLFIALMQPVFMWWLTSHLVRF